MLRAFAVVLLLSWALPLSAQSLGEVAARERERRDGARARAPQAFTEDDLRKYAAERPPEASPLPAEAPPAAADALPEGEAPREDVYRRHWTSAEAYLRQCEERLRAAKQAWLEASDGGSSVAVESRARRAVESAASALERAQQYRDQAEGAARLSATLPASALR